MKRISIVLAGLLAAISINFAHAAEATLYDQLGGKPGVTKLIDDFVGQVAADKRINGFFANANIPRLKMLLVEQICAGTGGGCTYTGKNMAATHKGMNIKSADFNALAEDMQKAMQANDLPIGAQNGLLAFLAPMKPDVDNK